MSFKMIDNNLNKDDDPGLWEEILNCLSEDTYSMLFESPWKDPIYLIIGACSHWFRPHQTRWKASGGFAWPSGYGGSLGHSVKGLPEFEWSVVYLWDNIGRIWKPTNKIKGKKKLTLRVAVPTRTAQHNQAAIHSIWEKGTPEKPNRKLTRFYGFKKKEKKWECVAFNDIEA